MAYSRIYEILLPIFLTIGVGYVFGRFKEMNLKPVIDLVLYVTVPCLVLSSIIQNPLDPKDFIIIPVAATFVIFGVGALLFAIVRGFQISYYPGMFVSSMFMNSGILVFPIALSAYGREGLSKAILFDAVNGLLLFTIGVAILLGKEGFKNMFKLPVIYAIIAATLLNLFRVSPPAPILNTFSFIGDITIPIMLIVLGYQLNYVRSFVVGPAIYSSVLRLGFGFLLALAFVNIFKLTGILKEIIILSSSMPTAINSLALTSEYKVDADLAATTVITTTVISFFTIPLILHYMI